jgi:hypothetical protein
VRGVSGKIGRNQPSASRRSSANFPGFKLLGDVWLSSLAHAQTRCPDDCSVEWLEPHVGDADLSQASSQSVCECSAALTKDRVSGVKEINTAQRVSRVGSVDGRDSRPSLLTSQLLVVSLSARIDPATRSCR